MSGSHEGAAGDLAAAGLGVAVGVASFLGPVFLMGRHGTSFGYVLAWAMIWAPACTFLYDTDPGHGVVRRTAALAMHAAGLTLLFSPIFMLGRLIGTA